MTLDGESIVDCGMGSDEALSLTLGLEALHFPLSSSSGKMRVLDPVVIAQSAGAVLSAATQNLHRGPVGSQPVGHDLLGCRPLLLEQFAE